MRKVFVLVERRADYSRYKPILEILKEEPFFEIYLVVTGVCLLDIHGKDINYIEQDGFHINATIDMFNENSADTGGEMVKSMSRVLFSVVDELEKAKPDIVLSGFDIGANFAVTIAAAHMNIPVAHIQGGEVTGSIDESIRHAMSKFAHIHFPATDDARERLIRLGENPNDIYVVGCPSIDVLKNTPIINKEILENKYDLNFSKPFIILIQHPVTTESDSSFDQIKNTIDAITKLKIQTIALLPNNDFGYSKIIEQIKSSGIKWYPSLPTLDFINLYRNAWAIVGNSSSGIHESPTFGIPAVNIGNRQMGRQRAFNVIDTPNNTIEIQKAIQKALFDMKFRNKVKNIINPYGQGSSAKEIVKILKEVSLEEKIQKVFYENE